MKLTAKEVMSINQRKMGGFPWDEELLDTVINSFDYPVSIDSILYRYADVLNGVSTMVAGDVCISDQSSVTELDISYDLYERCAKAGIMTIEDINRERCLSVLSFEDYADLTAALLKIRE